jgi:hypothetical protein
MAADDLDVFIDETIRLGAEKGYHPTIFIAIRRKLGTRQAIKKLVASGDIQSEFRRLSALGLMDCTIEAAVLKFPTEFTKGEQEAAQFRLNQIKGGAR